MYLEYARSAFRDIRVIRDREGVEKKESYVERERGREVCYKGALSLNGVVCGMLLSRNVYLLLIWHTIVPTGCIVTVADSFAFQVLGFWKVNTSLRSNVGNKQRIICTASIGRLLS